MLDRIDYHFGDPTPRKINIHEHRAPTDDSVRLLREMKQAARDEVIHEIRVEDNTVNCVVQTLRSPYDVRRHTRVVLDINGKRLVVESNISDQADQRAWAESVMQTVAREIAIAVLPAALSRALK